MIITRTPLRVSLLGGGTDFSSWYTKHGALVVGGAINQYLYVTARSLPPYHDFKTRVVYSQIEHVKANADIDHRAVKACINYAMGHQRDTGLEITTLADMPSRSGTGSSSSFAVGLLNALHALRGEHSSPYHLAKAAMHVEQDMMLECVGCQDQIFAAFGGFNEIRFHRDGSFNVYPINISVAALAELESRLMLLYTNVPRTSSDVAKTYVPTIAENAKAQTAMTHLAEQGLEAIYAGKWDRVGELLDNAWQIKRGLGAAITNPQIDDLYSRARLSGAVGGKITGAGGGGCMLLLLKDPTCRMRVKNLLRDCVPIKFKFDHDGSRVLYSDRRSIHE